jgi:hypothetical protein
MDLLRRLATIAKATSAIALPFSEINVPDLIDSGTSKVYVVVVRRKLDSSKDLIEVLAALSKSECNVAGALLIE